MKTQLVTALLALALLSFNAVSVAAKRVDWTHHQSFLVAQQANKTISKEQAVRIAKRRVDGKVMSAKLYSSGAASHYRVNILTDKGRMKTVVVNARR